VLEPTTYTLKENGFNTESAFSRFLRKVFTTSELYSPVNLSFVASLYEPTDVYSGTHATDCKHRKKNLKPNQFISLFKNICDRRSYT
jgi:hypothetical protein